MRVEGEPECKRCGCRCVAVHKNGNDPCTLGGGDCEIVTISSSNGTDT